MSIKNKNRRVEIGLIVSITCMVLTAIMPPQSTFAMEVDNEPGTQISIYLSARGARNTKEGNEYWSLIRQLFADVLIDVTSDSLRGQMSVREHNIYDEAWYKPLTYGRAIHGVQVDSVPSYVKIFRRGDDGSISEIRFYGLIANKGRAQVMWMDHSIGIGKIIDMKIGLRLGRQGEFGGVNIWLSYESDEHTRGLEMHIYPSDLDNVVFNFTESKE